MKCLYIFRLKEVEHELGNVERKNEQLVSDRENLLDVIKQKDASIKDLSQR